MAFSYNKDYRYITKSKLKMRENDAPLLMQTRSRMKSHERSVLEMAVKTWNSQTVAERNIPDVVKYKRYLLRQ